MRLSSTLLYKLSLHEGKDRFDHWNVRRGTVPIIPLLKLGVVLELNSSLRNLLAALLKHPDRYPLQSLLDSAVEVCHWAGEERGSTLSQAVVEEICTYIDTELAKPEPQGRSKKAIEEREHRQHLRIYKTVLPTSFAQAAPTSGMSSSNQPPHAKRKKISD